MDWTRRSVWSLTSPFGQLFNQVQDSSITCLCGSTDKKNSPVLLLGMSKGNIVIKDLPSFEYKTMLTGHLGVGHREAVRRIVIGPSHTFFSAGVDKKAIAWQWVEGVDTIKS